METIDCEVLVVGAGPTGLSAALALRAQGVDVRIVDRAPGLHHEARASAIHARTLELLAPYGVADRIVSYANPMREVVFFNADGREVKRNRPRPIDSPYPAMQNLQQWRTESLLAETLDSRGISVERSARCTGLAQDERGVTVAIDRDGDAGAIRARFVIGADGARSAVRHALGVRMEGGDYPERWLAGEIAAELPAPPSQAEVILDSDCVVMRFPLDGGYLFFATLREGELEGVSHGAVAPVEVRRVFARTFGRFPHLACPVLEVPWTGVFTMHHCALPAYRDGRVFLAGDAAHLTSAAGGNGMNAGIQDAMNLAWRLAAHLLGAAESLLDGYSVDRHEMFEWIHASSDAAHRLLAAHDPDAFRLGEPGGLRALLARALHRETAGPREADRALGETAFAYTRDAGLVDLGGQAGALRAGMRVPATADLGVGFGSPRPWSALYDGFHWTVVLAVPTREGLRAADVAAFDRLAMHRLGGRVRTVVAVGDAFAWNAPAPTVYLVRPDGYVAFRATAAAGSLPDPRALAEWLDRDFPVRRH